MPQKCVLYQFGEEVVFESGKDGVKNVFPDEKNPATLVVVYDDRIVKYVGIPFVSTSPRKQNDIEA